MECHLTLGRKSLQVSMPLLHGMFNKVPPVSRFITLLVGLAVE